ncbi:hypothetical protein Tsubulata_008959 [Turnera subulata]|uniref:Uncharacterized protein n=1 Tax=Turnera subulata TaxID=218843 RepID=A0A9Q0FQU2_9ROSI|nr:hypothetical protein Tsubulata_008959 [Turnera subulata]
MGGICSTCQSSESTRCVAATGKLIHEDGQLEEFSNPVRVSHILGTHPTCFICNADDMGFDDHVFAIDDDEQLRPGELYFALPLTWLNNPLTPQQMADLAVKASLALKKFRARRGMICSWCGARAQIEVLVGEAIKSRKQAVGGGGDDGGCSEEFLVKRRGGGGGGNYGRKFPKLSAILEE